MLLLNIDEETLYTAFPHDYCVQTVRETLALCCTPLPEGITLNTEILKLLLEHYFEVDGKFYRQSRGTATGAAMTPSLANTTLTKCEEENVFCSGLINKIKCYCRFIAIFIV